MSKDDKEKELLNSSSTVGSIWTDEDSKKVLQEINFDSWDANGSPVTVTVGDIQHTEGDERDIWTVHNDVVTGGLGADDVITVTTADIDAGSNGTKQLDLFDDYLDEGKYVPIPEIDPWNEQ